MTLETLDLLVHLDLADRQGRTALLVRPAGLDQRVLLGQVASLEPTAVLGRPGWSASLVDRAIPVRLATLAHLVPRAQLA